LSSSSAAAGDGDRPAASHPVTIGATCCDRPVQPSVVSWYDANASRLAATYEAVPPTPTREWLADLLPAPPALVVDVGAGTGRDAGAFAAAGYDVVAVEPSPGMRAEAERRHASSRIRWLPDSLPGLDTASRLGLAADVVSLSAVWQHVAPLRPPARVPQARGPAAVGRPARADAPARPRRRPRRPPGQPCRGRGTGAGPRHAGAPDGGAADRQGRPGVSWTSVVLRLPDDGTGALPLLRHLILADAKSATYKLGLLRALCRAADGAAGLAVEDGDDHVRLPLGPVGPYWLRLYLPLAAADLPQAPGNRRGAEGLGFSGPGWQALAVGAASQRDLRIGAVFGGAAAAAAHAALREAADHVCRMPANYLTYPAGERILEASRARAKPPDGSLVLDGPALAAFGMMRVPRHLWTALQRFAAWVEPALIGEWARLMQRYATAQGRRLEAGAVAAAMTWSDPDCDVARALSLLEEGHAVHCVWSGKRLTAERLDVDHCLPWSAWPCGDLWNLLPADRRVNQQSKRDRLPSADALRAARDAIAAWWQAAYLRPGDAVLPGRFAAEAHGAWPASTSAVPATPTRCRRPWRCNGCACGRIRACRSGVGGPERCVPSGRAFPTQPAPPLPSCSLHGSLGSLRLMPQFSSWIRMPLRWSSIGSRLVSSSSTARSQAFLAAAKSVPSSTGRATLKMYEEMAKPNTTIAVGASARPMAFAYLSVGP